MTVEEAYNYLTSPSYCTIDCDNCNNCCDDCDVNASLNLAVKALEKQVPKVVIDKGADQQFSYLHHYACPVCNHPMLISISEINQYCRECGQRLRRGNW